jgi:hypothetical protein
MLPNNPHNPNPNPNRELHRADHLAIGLLISAVGLAISAVGLLISPIGLLVSVLLAY